MNEEPTTKKRIKVFACPSCRMTVFNRRIPHCEFCHADLPRELLFSEAEMSGLDLEYDGVQQRRKKRHERFNRIGTSSGEQDGLVVFLSFPFESVLMIPWL